MQITLIFKVQTYKDHIIIYLCQLVTKQSNFNFFHLSFFLFSFISPFFPHFTFTMLLSPACYLSNKQFY